MLKTEAHTGRLEHFDFIKGIAIISVILLHSSHSDILYRSLAPFHIWQAVPIFMVVAGATTFTSLSRNDFNFQKYYSKIPQKIAHILAWYCIIVLFPVMVFNGQVSLDNVIYWQIGPGAYFIPLIIQHMLIFPLFILLKNKIHSDHIWVAGTIILTAVLEYLCVIASMDKEIYRPLYARFIAAAALGTLWCTTDLFNKKYLLFPLISIAYIIAESYAKIQMPFIPRIWIFQHYPSFFYTTAMCLLFSRYFSKIPLYSIACKAGKASLMIFLVQALYFSPLRIHFAAPVMIQYFVAVIFCCTAGMLLNHLVEYLYEKWRTRRR